MSDPISAPVKGAPPRLLEQVRNAIRRLHYSYRTEQAYVHWITRYIWFHGKRHPAELGAPDVTAFMTHLAREREVSASTQNQALSALLFLYGRVLEVKLPWMDGIERAKRPVRVCGHTGAASPARWTASDDARNYTISKCSMPLVMSRSLASLPCSLMLSRTSLVESAKRSASS